jgi:transketolase
MTFEAQSGHPGGSLSSVEILCSLYFSGVLRYNATEPHWPDRDRFVQSKGHASPVLYAVLAEAGYLPTDELKTFRKLNSRLQGHPKMDLPGVEMSSGSLGQGLSFSIGHCFAARLDAKDYRVYCLLGDGECQEGQTWEALMAAPYHNIDNLVAIIDRNGVQNDWFVKDTMELEPLDSKLRAFGWHVLQVDGHNFEELLRAYDEARTIKGQPTAIIARTVKGKGVSFMENNPDWHGKGPNAEQREQALAEIGDA